MKGDPAVNVQPTRVASWVGVISQSEDRAIGPILKAASAKNLATRPPILEDLVVMAGHAPTGRFRPPVRISRGKEQNPEPVAQRGQARSKNPDARARRATSRAEDHRSPGGLAVQLGSRSVAAIVAAGGRHPSETQAAADRQVVRNNRGVVESKCSAPHRRLS